MAMATPTNTAFGEWLKTWKEGPLPETWKATEKHYEKGGLIARQGERCRALYVLMDGAVKAEMTAPDGTLLTVERLHAPHPLAPAFLFAAENRFPVQVTAFESVRVVCIPKESVVKLLTVDPAFLAAFLALNSEMTRFLSERLQLLSMKTIKGKLAQYLLARCAPGQTTLTLDRSQKELAAYFGVERPSLARSMADMVTEGLIDCRRRQVSLLDLNGLRRCLDG
jgi:CRP-like cAMP-binding protein